MPEKNIEAARMPSLARPGAMLGVLLMLIFFGLSDPTAPTEEASTAATTENIPDFEGLVPATRVEVQMFS